MCNIRFNYGFAKDLENIKTFESMFGEDFVYGLRTSAHNLNHFLDTGNEIIIHSRLYTREHRTPYKDRFIRVYPMLEEDYTLADKHNLSPESILLLTIIEEEFVTGNAWDVVTSIVYELDLEKTKEVLGKLPKELYDMNAQSIIDYLVNKDYAK